MFLHRNVCFIYLLALANRQPPTTNRQPPTASTYSYRPLYCRNRFPTRRLLLTARRHTVQVRLSSCRLDRRARFATSPAQLLPSATLCRERERCPCRATGPRASWCTKCRPSMETLL